MEENPQTTPHTPTPETKQSADHAPIMHTYEADLALAMDTTDARVVQELLKTANTREMNEKERETIAHQRGWYTAGGIILLVLALAAGVYGVYYYRNLTVKVVPTLTVGVFQSVQPLISTDTTFIAGLEKITTDQTLTEGKPFLVPIVSDSTSLTPLAPSDVLTYLGIRASEPFLAAISLVRLGVMNTGTTVSPFLIFSTPLPENASKEFLILEPNLLDLVAPVLGIDLSNQANEVGKGFTSTYMYNLPVRTLKSTNLDTKEQTIILYYGYATDNTIVVATNPTVLKAIYDTIIRQR